MLSTSRRADFTEEYVIEKLSNLVEMTYTTFYSYCASVLTAEGFTDVKVAREYGISGMNVWASKDGVDYAVLCTRPRQDVRCPIIQRAMGACSLHQGVQPMVMSTSAFAKDAVKFARESTPPVFLYGRDNFFDYELAKRLREIDNAAKANAKIVQPLTGFTKYTEVNGDRTCVLHGVGSQSLKAMESALENIWIDNADIFIIDLFDAKTVAPVYGAVRRNRAELLRRLFNQQGRMGFVWVRSSVSKGLIMICMPQIKSRIPDGGYYI